ncbi:MAG: hypothetical protein ACRDKJ_12950 [Actinomycetota bacterium]
MPDSRKRKPRRRPKRTRELDDDALWARAWDGLPDLADDVRDYLIARWRSSFTVHELEELWARSPEANADAFRAWAGGMLALADRVALHAAGRASLPGGGFAAELRWVQSSGGPKLRSVTFEADDYINTDDTNIRETLRDLETALHLRLARDAHRSFRRMPRERPAHGKPPPSSYYTALLEAEAALLAEGHPAPARELAERLGENRATIRSHLSKARRYRDRWHTQSNESTRKEDEDGT